MQRPLVLTMEFGAVGVSVRSDCVLGGHQPIEQRQHDRCVRHREDCVDPIEQARLQQRVPRLADGAERAAKSVILPGEFEDVFIHQRIDEIVGLVVDADQRMCGKGGWLRIKNDRLGRR
jgi:hypothetical protein